MQNKKEFADVQKVVDGKNINQDLLQLIGYCFSLGCTEKIFPSEHCIDLANAFLNKHDAQKDINRNALIKHVDVNRLEWINKNVKKC